MESERVTLAQLRQMKRDGRRIVGSVAYEYPMALLLDRAGVELISVGDSVGQNLWGQPTQLEVTMDEMVLAARAVRRGVRRALLSVDLPFGPVQLGPEQGLRAAIRLVQEAGADLVKVDAAADYLDVVRAIVRADIPVFAQFGLTPQSARRWGGWEQEGSALAEAMGDRLLDDARALQEAGAALLDITNVGPNVAAAVARAVEIPVLGGRNTGPECDGRILVAYTAVGYLPGALDDGRDRYANISRTILDAVEAYAADVRDGREVRGWKGAGGF